MEHTLMKGKIMQQVAIVTGGSSGLGRELVRALTISGWQVITDARDAERLREATADMTGAQAIPGNVTDPDHRAQLTAAAQSHGRLDLLVHNASTLGPTPLRPLAETNTDAASVDGVLQSVLATNVAGPLALTLQLLPLLQAAGGTVLAVSSDAAVEHYEGWGYYGASKAALDHLTLTIAAENPTIGGYAVDPGDMRTPMHQAAFPGEDISDRPLPAAVVPHLLALMAARPDSGRYRAADVDPQHHGGTDDHAA